MKEKNILKLNDDWVIRGTKKIPRLFNKKTNKIIKLDDNILKYILECNGTKTYSDIIKKYNLNEKIVLNFYKQFLDEGIILEIKEYQKKNISVNLGPKEPWLKEVHIDITNNCNLRCKHCFWGTNLKQDTNISKEKWFTFINDIKKMGVAKVVLSGGEAFTNKDLLSIIKCCYENEIMVASIFTNGTILDEYAKKIIEFLSEKELSTVFYISLDGYKKEQHDFIRGNGNFDKTVDFIQKLSEYKKQHDSKYQIMINSLLHKKNYTDLIKWYDFLEKMGVYGWRFTTGRITGFFKMNASQIKITSKECFKEYKKLISYIVKKYKNNEKILYLNIENFFTTRSLINHKMYIFDKKLPICDYKTNACSIDPKGNVQFCTGWQNIKYGNVFDDNIKKIWYSNKLQNIKQMKIEQIKECQDCKYLKYCGGGCRLECKDIYSKDIDICENFELFEKEMIPILKSLNINFEIE